MSIFNRILFAGDLSERSRAAFGAACSLARGPDAHLHILSVAEPVLVAEPPGPRAVPASRRPARQYRRPSQGGRGPVAGLLSHGCTDRGRLPRQGR